MTKMENGVQVVTNANTDFGQEYTWLLTCILFSKRPPANGVKLRPFRGVPS